VLHRLKLQIESQLTGLSQNLAARSVSDYKNTRGTDPTAIPSAGSQYPTRGVSGTALAILLVTVMHPMPAFAVVLITSAASTLMGPGASMPVWIP
jgi:hypothetical protein